MNTVHVDRPWGCFDRFVHNEACTVKVFTIHPGGRTSLQYHKIGEEFWRVISGDGVAVLGEETFPAKAGDEFVIPPETNHRFIGGDHGAQVLEVSFGVFDEANTVHVEDARGSDEPNERVG